MLLVVPRASADAAGTFKPPKRDYLALGDSLAYGFQSWRLAAGLPPNEFDTGYVDLFAERLRTLRPSIEVVNYGCPGETTTSFVTEPCLFTSLGHELHDAYDGSQLSAALRFLRAHRGLVSPITVSLWGGDLREFIASCSGDLGCILQNGKAEISQLALRLGGVLGDLRAAAPEAEVLVTGAWNTAIGTFPQTDPLFVALNEAMAQAASAHGARFAETFPLFNPQGDIAAETLAICTLTLLCPQDPSQAPDSHPSDLGYRAIADAVFEASRYMRLDEQ